MKTFWCWGAIVGGATLLDLLVRFGLPFDMTRVLVAEAVLFPATAFAFLLLMRRSPGREGLPRMFQIFLIGGFALAGLRSGLWAAGLPVGIANLLVLAAAILAWSGFRLRRRSKGRGSEPHS